MIENFLGDSPEFDDNCYIHPQATLMGKVSITGPSLVMAGARLIGDYGAVNIAAGCTIEENCVLHAGSYDLWAAGEKGKLVLEGGVVVGHGAVIHGRRIGRRSLIGMNATILENVDIGEGCIVAAGAVVLEGSIIPDGSFVAGVPAQVKGLVSGAQSRWVGRSIAQICSDIDRKIDQLHRSA
jgi:carbonic anhydrase/acetyltransferase-like protein (isoleucine patch superfamily)